MKKSSLILALLILVFLSSTFAQQTVKIGFRLSPMFVAAINGNSSPSIMPTKKFRTGLQLDLALGRHLAFTTGAEYGNMEIQREVNLLPSPGQETSRQAGLMIPVGLKIYPIHGRKRHLFLRTELLSSIRTTPDLSRKGSALVFGIGVEKDIVDQQAKIMKKQKKLRKQSIREKQRSYYTGLSLIQPLGRSAQTSNPTLTRANLKLISLDFGYFF